MTAKEFLSRSRRLQARIDQLNTARQSAWDHATSTTTSAGMDVIQSGSVSRKGEVFGELSSEIDSERRRLDGLKAETLRVIDQIPDNTLASLLIAYYVRGRTWEETAKELHYSYRHVVHVLHPQALVEVDAILKKSYHTISH